MDSMKTLTMSNQALQYLYLVAEKVRPTDIAGVKKLAALYDAITPVVTAYEMPLLKLTEERRAMEGSIQHYRQTPAKKHDVVLAKIEELHAKCEEIDTQIADAGKLTFDIALPQESIEYVKEQIDLMLSENSIESKRSFGTKSVVCVMAELYDALV